MNQSVTFTKFGHSMHDHKKIVQKRDHGGGLDAAMAQYGGTRDEWIDLSTGINPAPYPVSGLMPSDWATLPDQAAQDALINAARGFWSVPDGAAILAAPGADVTVVGSQEAAILALYGAEFEIIVLDLILEQGSALAVADFASYRRPNARVIFVTNTSFFSDGSIFAHSSNACAYVQSETPPEDLAAMCEHYAVPR